MHLIVSAVKTSDITTVASLFLHFLLTDLLCLFSFHCFITGVAISAMAVVLQRQ